MKIQNNIIVNNYTQTNALYKIKESPAFERKIGYSIYSSKCPMGLNYFNPSFGHLSVESRQKRDEKLKERFAQARRTYIPYDKVWSDKRIYETLDKVGAAFDELYEKGNLNIQSLNDLLKQILPEEVASRIEIKDMSEAVDFLKQQNVDTKTAKEFISNSYALEHCPDCDSTMFVDSEGLYEGEEDEKLFAFYCLKELFLHELKHSLTHVCTNKNKVAFVKYSINDYEQLYDRIFSKIRNSFDMDCQFTVVDELSLNSLCKLLKIKDESALFEEMESNLASIIEEELNDDSSLSRDMFETEGFYEYMSINAADEKEASRTNYISRKIFGKDKPLDYELESLLFGEIEKFFKQKADDLRRASGEK